MKVIEGGVTAAKGYKAAGLRAGIKAGKTNKDMAMICSEKEAVCAGTFTKNVVKAAPVFWDKDVVYKEGKAQAVVVNSGIANACTGEEGLSNCKKEAEKAGELLSIAPEHVLVASTGVIGAQLVMDVVEKGIEMLVPELDSGKEAGENAATAIMTTDTVPKEVAVEFQLGGKTCHVGAMGKGSGMICPNMATTLNVVTTDCAISAELLQTALSDVVQYTYNCLYIDGDQSTNDTCVVLANGLAENAEITEQNDDYAVFRQALYIAMSNITKMLAKDGEGATKLLECTVTGAKDRENALAVAKSVIASDLLKCAMFGADANWGRVLCAVGYAPAEFDIDQVAVTLASRAGSVDVCKNGAGIDFSEDIAKTVLLEDEIEILVSVGDGPAAATAWGCDLTYDYVKINGDYRS